MGKRTQRGKNTFPLLLRALFPLLLFGGILFGFYILAQDLGFRDLSAEGLRALVAQTGAYGVAFFILLSFLQVTFIPIPSTVTILGGALLFGPLASFFYSLVGIFLGSALAFLLGRLIGRPFVAFVAGGRETVDYYVEKANGREFVIFFFMFLLPAFPDDLLCAIAGITRLKPSQFACIQLISRPIATAATLTFMSGTLIPYHGWGIVVWVLIILASVLAFLFSLRHADAIARAFDRMLEKLAVPFQKKKSDTDDKE